jgi:hypothetical protein
MSLLPRISEERVRVFRRPFRRSFVSHFLYFLGRGGNASLLSRNLVYSAMSFVS